MRDERAFLLDILQSCEMIESFVSGKTLENFTADVLLQEAVMRRLGIIGEAARHLSRETQAAMPTIPWGDIVRMRNVLVHVCFGIDFKRVWSTASSDLAPLAAEIRRHLGRNFDPNPTSHP